jgi:hypothetical protein
MAVQFLAENHSYKSTDGSDIPWISVTSFVGNFKKPFDGQAIAQKCAKNKKSKWYGMTPQQILDVWKGESERAMTLGTFYHNQREADLCGLETLEREGKALPVIKPIVEGDIKYAPDQKLTDGIYPELLVYLKSAGICGQSDLVEVVNGFVNITDYKTNKEIKYEGFRNWEGITDRMLGPLSHLDDCNLNHYNVQLSLYMYMILKHNPHLKPGRLTLHHILFETDGEDQHGYPITRYNENGDPIVKDIIPYEMGYLKHECASMVTWLRNNRSKIKKK